MVNYGEALPADDKCLNAIKGGLVLLGPCWEHLSSGFCSERRQDTSVVGEFVQECGQVSYKPQEGTDVQGRFGNRPVQYFVDF